MTLAVRFVTALFLAVATAAGYGQTRPQRELPEPPGERFPELPLEIIMPPPPEPDPAARVPSPEELDGVKVGPALERLVGELDHAEFARREAATRALCDASAVEQLQIYAVLARTHLSAEQRHRLMTVVRERLISRPRGAVGINMSFEPVAPGDPAPGVGVVVVMSVVQGLPADGHLRRSDRITHVDGEQLFNSNDLIRRVQEKLPGETVELVVERPIPIGAEVPEGPEAPAAMEVRRMETLRFTLVLASTDELEMASGSGQAQGGPVVFDRQAEAAEAAERFGPRVRVIGLKK